jgi:hypothetical protein
MWHKKDEKMNKTTIFKCDGGQWIGGDMSVTRRLV